MRTDGRTDGRTHMAKLTVAFPILRTRLKFRSSVTENTVRILYEYQLVNAV